MTSLVEPNQRANEYSPEQARQQIERLHANIAAVVLGKPELIRLTLVALLADGHLLLEDVPGLGKTLLARALAASLDCSFHRIQFTPDLLPSDLLGTSIYQMQKGELIFQPGPVFAQVILADEINRATPRTQSALLEAMSDRQVSIDGQTRPLGPPFIVLATQNPFEFEGTYPLPESQLDRFLMRLSVGYPSRETERDILTQHRTGEPIDSLKPVLRAEDVLMLQRLVRQVAVANPLVDYLLDIVHSTRTHAAIAFGASTRAALGLYRAVQALALVEGRMYAVPDDVKRLAKPVLAHRILTQQMRVGGTGDSAVELIDEIVGQLAVPE